MILNHYSYRIHKSNFLSYAEAKEAVLTYYLTFKNNTVNTISKELGVPETLVHRILESHFSTDNRDKRKYLPSSKTIRWKIAQRKKLIHALEAYNASAPESEQVNI